MYLKTSVAIPQVPGKIITKSKGGSVYVLFQYGRKYVPEKRYAIPLRAVIGKVVSGKTDRILPNERFQEFFPEIPVPVFPLHAGGRRQNVPHPEFYGATAGSSRWGRG